jgi:hypothetical protein
MKIYTIFLFGSQIATGFKTKKEAKDWIISARKNFEIQRMTDT